jgi:hypothetical protein
LRREDDRRRLAVAFAMAFDRSKVEQVLFMEDAAIGSRLEVLGQGTHFKAWRLPSRQSGQPDLVLKRALREWLPLPARRPWRAAMSTLGGCGGLVPPFEVIEDGEEKLAVVMPYGPAPLTAAAAHWQPLAERVVELRTALAAQGLALGDVAQGRSWEGIPFLYDFSDLSMIRR